MSFNPLAATGMVVSDVDVGEVFCGSCFAFRSGRHFLTAAHCVPDVDVTQTGVITPVADHAIRRRVERIERHPTADLAMLTLADGEPEVDPFRLFVTNYAYGEEFFAFGYPEDVLQSDEGRPTPRVFKGHFQRLMDYRSPPAYAFKAAELSIAAPSGLSGGPVFRTEAPVVVLGVVVGNEDSRTGVHSERFEIEPGRTREVVEVRYVSYGIALMLDAVGDWIEERVPPLNRPPGE